MARRFDPKDLVRWLEAVSWLDGRLVPTQQGPLLVWPRHVVDPRPLAGLDDELPTREQLVAAVLMRREPIELSARRLARIQRDIKRLRHPGAQAAVAENHRKLRRHGRIDDTRLDERQAQLDALSARWNRKAGPADVVVALIGEARADRLERLVERWRYQPRHILRRSRARLARVVAATRERRHPIAALERLPGRARLRRLRRAVAEVLSVELHGMPEEPPEGWRFDRSIDVQTELVGNQLIAEQHRQLVAADLGTKGARVIRCFALMFELDVDAPKAFADVDTLRLATRRLAAATEHLAGTPLTCSQALALLAVPKLPEAQLRSAAAWLGEGMPIAVLSRVAKRGQLYQLAGLSSKQRAAYAQWMAQLVDHYADHGIAIELEPDDFGELAEAYGAQAARDVALVARCLIHHHQRGDRAVPQLLSLLDSTLALFRGLPDSLRAVIAQISASEAGLGRKLHPAYAAWLDDDPLLDRYLTLQRLADGHTRLSKRARQDFERGEGTRSASKTRRWMRKRVDQLEALAYDQQLDAVVARLVEERFGVPALDVDESWRNALRMQLLGGDNQGLLAELLGVVARGGERTELASNAAWLESKRAAFDVDAWLRPHDERVVIDGQTYRLHTEERPLDVLPMGIPFDTCLSLHGGMNAASAIVNALDVNKRVIYLRNSSGAIVARKLIAVTRYDALVGFRIYVALSPSAHPAVVSAIDELAARIAEQSGLGLAAGGEIESLHGGFWYDDGTVPFAVAGAHATSAAHVERLGRTLPDEPPPALAEEARIFAAAQAGEAAPLGHRFARGLIAHHVIGRLRERLEPPDLLAAVREDHHLAGAAFRAMRRELGARGALRWASTLADDWILRRELADLLRVHPPSPALAEATIDVAEEAVARATRIDDHGFAHDTFYFAVRHVAALAPSRAFAFAERLEAIWDEVIEDNPGCADCRQTGEENLSRAVLASYRASPDPDAVLRVLRAKRRRRLGMRRLALAVAARHVLDGGSEGCREVPGVRRLIDTVVSRAPELEGEPVVLAAWLRHCREDGSPGLRKLPPVHERPFEALGDLVDRFASTIEDLAAPFAKEAPRSPWERQHHRRHLTPHRRTLRERHAAGKDVAQQLAMLGDVEALRSRRESLAAEAVAAQTEHLDVDAVLEVWRQANRLGAPLEHAIHPRAVALVWDGVEALSEIDDADDRMRFLADATPHRELAERVDRLWPRPVALALARRALGAVNPYACPIAPRNLLGMWAHERLRGPLAEALGRVGEDEVLEQLVEAAQDETLSPILNPMLAAWSASERFEEEVLPLERDAETLARVAPVLVENHPARCWVDAYLALSDALGASRFLEAIADASFSRTEARRRLDQHDEPRQPHAAWLRAELERRS